ncbi:MAG: BrnT family toxin [Symploca sp. SIO2G7]|nr:BrnT family toxin [Symploca sp. SIO2G7]
MSKLRFEWDNQKAQNNEKKHGISFNEAQTVFYDENARLIYDSEHSSLEEERYVLLGMSSLLHLLVVSHTYQKDVEFIRLISARKATKRERQQYRSFF